MLSIFWDGTDFLSKAITLTITHCMANKMHAKLMFREKRKIITKKYQIMHFSGFSWLLFPFTSNKRFIPLAFLNYPRDGGAGNWICPKSHPWTHSYMQIKFLIFKMCVTLGFLYLNLWNCHSNSISTHFKYTQFPSFNSSFEYFIIWAFWSKCIII